MSEKIYLSKEEQLFLMEMLEIKNPAEAAEAFARLMVQERADPVELKKYLKKIMRTVLSDK